MLSFSFFIFTQSAFHTFPPNIADEETGAEIRERMRATQDTDEYPWRWYIMRNFSNEAKINYQKQVDEPNPPYTQIIPDSRYDEIEAYLKRKRGIKEEEGKKMPFHFCLQFPVSTTVQQTTGTNTPAGNNEPKPTKDQSTRKDADNSATMKAACLPVGGGGCPPPVKMMLCLPCPPPDAAVAAPQPNAAKKKPKDYTYRCESRELRGGNLYQCCQCNKRNGLQHDCPRTPCQGRPACLNKPWPDCWPSGGCHGIDYSREKGIKRYDPCAEQRFDKKECKPPASSGKPDCGGNMMIVVCPSPQQS